jgi:hypothetical protein
MNWNGKHKNGVLGHILSCREQIAATKKNGSSSDAASWLLEKVNPEENTAALISLVSPMTTWAERLPDEDRERWLVWAMTTHPNEIKKWMGYAEDWTMMPAEVCRNVKDVVRLAHKGRLPIYYLLPANPRPQDIENHAVVSVMEGIEARRIELATVKYIEWNGGWYKIHFPKLPSKSAVSRALRLYALGALVGRTITSTNDLWMYELIAIKGWALYNGDIVNGVSEPVARTLTRLVTEPEIVEQLPNG